MKGGKTPLGYTIVEVLIVLAVSGMVFLMAINFVNGKQAKTSFQTATNELASQIQDLITSVVDGQYSDYPIKCIKAGAGISASATAAATPNLAEDNTQGTNEDCVFLGKVFKAAPSDTKYQVINIAGLRADDDGKPITSLAASRPAIIDGLTSTSATPQNIDITSIKTPAGTIIDGFGIIQNFATSDGRGARQMPSIYTAPGGNVASGALVPAVKVCLSDGQKYAVITVGTNESQQSSKIKMLGSTPC